MSTINSLKPIAIDDVDWSICVEPELDGPEGHFATGDDAYDDAICAQIRKAMEWSEWAWCVVTVKGEWKGLEATDTLGGCNYANEKGFKEGGYYEDMRMEVLRQLQEQAGNIAEYFVE
jgi:hypothetical protein